MAVAYSEKLKDPRWQKKRLEIFNRDNWMCQCCGDIESNLQVHHIRYIRSMNPWEYENYDLITWCVECHAAYSAYEASNGKPEYFEALKVTSKSGTKAVVIFTPDGLWLPENFRLVKPATLHKLNQFIINSFLKHG